MTLRNIWIQIRRIHTRILESFKCWIWVLRLNNQRVTILPGYTATSINKISFGNDVLISHQVFMQGVGGLTFGNKIMVGPRVSFITAGHDLLTRESNSRGITIDDGVWIGANAVILPGVIIGKGSIVAAGAVVTRDVSPGVIVGGVPARLISTLNGSIEEISYFKKTSWLSQF